MKKKKEEGTGLPYPLDVFSRVTDLFIPFLQCHYCPFFFREDEDDFENGECRFRGVPGSVLTPAVLCCERHPMYIFYTSVLRRSGGMIAKMMFRKGAKKLVEKSFNRPVVKTHPRIRKAKKKRVK